jgi:hypothetical protein
VVASADPSGSAEPSGLQSVAATSATNAWAVGEYATSAGSQTLILRWNGTTWTRVTSPNSGTGETLSGVAATSASSDPDLAHPLPLAQQQPHLLPSECAPRRT